MPKKPKTEEKKQISEAQRQEIIDKRRSTAAESMDYPPAWDHK